MPVLALPPRLNSNIDSGEWLSPRDRDAQGKILSFNSRSNFFMADFNGPWVSRTYNFKIGVSKKDTEIR